MGTTEKADTKLSTAHGLLFNETVDVLVGPEEQKFSVHKRILCARSTFFDSAFSGRWTKEKKTKTIELPTDAPEAFDLYLRCAYHDSIHIGGDAITNDTKPASCPGVEVQLINAYILADKLGDVAATKTLIDEMISYCNKCNVVMSRLLIDGVWQHTPDNSPLRRLYVDQYAYEAPAGEFTEMLAAMNKLSIPQEFLLQVIEEKTRADSGEKRRTRNKAFRRRHVSSHQCRYHQHDDDHPTCGEGCEWSKESRDEDSEMEQSD